MPKASRRHYVIYISGLGDQYDDFRRLSLKLWRIWGVQTQLVPMQWDKNTGFDEKYNRVNDAIEFAKKQGYTVSVVGESAGASMAINVASHRDDIHRVITICGTNNPQMKVAPRTLKRSPVFGISMQKLTKAVSRLDVKNTHTISARIDNIVATKYTGIPGANNHRIFSFGHLFTVSLCLTFLSGYVVALIKR